MAHSHARAFCVGPPARTDDVDIDDDDDDDDDDDEEEDDDDDDCVSTEQDGSK